MTNQEIRIDQPEDGMEQQLIDKALLEQDDDKRWKHIIRLHRLGSHRAFELAKDLCRSLDPQKRMTGIDVLAQLGVPKRTFPEECMSVVKTLLMNETDPDVLSCIGAALGHLTSGSLEWLPDLLKHEHHPNSDVRQNIVFALTGRDEPACVQALIRLADDPDDEVRNWAVFGLGSMTDLDSEEIRRVLRAHVTDPYPDVRGEALSGLAARGDKSTIPALVAEFRDGFYGQILFEAASRFKCRELHEELLEARDRLTPTLDAEPDGRCLLKSLDEAIQTTDPES